MSILPEKCPSCNHEVEWDKNEVHLLCHNPYCPSKRLSRLISFFELMEIDNVGPGVCEQLFKEGYTTVKCVLGLSEFNLLEMEGFGDKKSRLVYKSIHDSLKEVPLEKLQHASNKFLGLGSKKLKLLNSFNSKGNIPTLEQILEVDGFSEKSAKVYLDNIETFWEWVEDLPITIKEPVVTNSSLNEYNFVFTGVRPKDEMAFIESNGGKISGSISKKTTHLICKDPESNSSKLVKARDLGCKIWDITTLQGFLSQF